MCQHWSRQFIDSFNLDNSHFEVSPIWSPPAFPALALLLTQETPDPRSLSRPLGKDSEGKEGSKSRWGADGREVFRAGHRSSAKHKASPFVPSREDE